MTNQNQNQDIIAILQRVENTVEYTLSTFRRLEQKLETVITVPKKEENEYLTVKEVEQVLKIGRSTFDRYKKNGLIKTILIGNKLQIHRDNVRELLDKGIR